jgi:hypothetical protein
MTVRGRGRFWACPPAVAVLVVAIVIGVRAQSAQSLSTCTDAQLVPRVAELSVSQGAPGYVRLARDKQTIVRAYLTTPTGCTLSNKQSIAPVSATLDVSYPNSALTVSTQTTQTCAAGRCTNYAPLSGRLTAAPQISSTSDPFFVVPDFYLAPAGTTGTYNIAFTLNLTYIRNGLTTTYTLNGAATTGPKAVDQRTNALRILVVPMGDPTSPNTQWSSTDERTLQNVMTNAARAFPVPTGATPQLTPTTVGGIRYVISTSLLDVKSLGLMSSGVFCSNGGNWSTSQVSTGSLAGHTLKGDLLQRLADYNLLNKPPADMVVGVIDGGIAAKSATTPGCDDGRAATPATRAAGQVAWVRISTDPSYPTPLQMELLHPFGISDSNLTFHSTNVQADGAGPGKGYNVLLPKVIDPATGALGTNDHSIMNYNTVSPAPPYTNDNTLLEPNDWGDALCDLGGFDSVPLFQNCTLSTSLGTSEGAPATTTQVYQVSGIITGGGTNLRVTDGKTATGPDVPVGIASGNSALTLKLYSDCDGQLPLLPDVSLETYGGEGHHGLNGAVGQETTGDSFGGLVPLTGSHANANRAELWLNGVMKFHASSCDAAPDILSTSRAGQGTAAPGTIMRKFNLPDGNGRAIAFDPTNHFLYATLADSSTVYKLNMDGSVASSFGVGTTIGALAYNAATGHLYGGDYTGNGNVYDIDPGTIEGGQAAKTTLFQFNDEANCVGESQFIDGLEYRTTEGGQLAISGDICDTVFIKSLAGAAISSFATDNNSGITTDGAGGLWLARLTQGNAEYTQLTHVDASGQPLGNDLVLPGYAAEDLAYDSVTFAPTCVVWTNQATFAESAPEVRAVAVPCGATGANDDAIGVQTENTRFVSIQFTCGDPVDTTDTRPTFTLANGLVPGTEGTVIAPFTNQLFCGESPGKIISTASNGWSWTGLGDPQATVQATGTSTDPTPNIASPLNGSNYRRGEFVHFEGSAFDAFNGAITGSNLAWTDDKPSLHGIGTGTSFDLRLAADAPLGPHHITLAATDNSSHTASTTVTINVGPALCPSTKNCP